MSKLVVRCFSISLDGYGAGPNQDLENPMGIGGMVLHKWVFATNAFKRMHNNIAETLEVGSGIDEEFAANAFDNIGAWILGRNMFGPIRGPWPDDAWKGWWGEEPPYHTPVFVLTNFSRPPLEMKGGTTFYFVTDGIQSALEQAQKAANGKDIRLGGGVATIKEYLMAGLVDELHLALSPTLLGTGENLFEGVNLAALGYQCVEFIPSKAVGHMILKKE